MGVLIFISRSVTFTSALLLVLISAPISGYAQDRPGYFRSPAIYGETIFFSAEGDLWSVSTDGGKAQRLTTHAAEETFPAVSPDGKMLAFSASYEGPTEVYTMPLEGGLPVRHTYHGGTVVGWHPDGHLLYRTTAFSTLPDAQLVSLDPESGVESMIPLAQAAEGSYDPSGRTLYFTRLSSQGSQTKRYRGGTAQNLWKYTDGAQEAEPLTADYPGTSRSPMWWNSRLYFASDRDGSMNLWSMKPDGSDLVQHTHHDGWDILSPSLGNGRIVYQLGADIRLFDTASEEDRPVPITIVSDFDQTRERWIEKPMDYLTGAHLSPDGKQVVLIARGEVFVAPVKKGRFVQVTRSPGVRSRMARFTPDGQSILMLSDESGEVEWWRVAADGTGKAERLTKDGHVLRHDGIPSPDGHWLAQFDHDQVLTVYDLKAKTGRRVAAAEKTFVGFGETPSWSPDSRWLAYSLAGPNDLTRLFVFDIRTGESTPVTSERYDSWNPVWSRDGKWLHFLSDRHFQSLVNSPWGSRAPDPFFDRKTKIFAIALVDGERFPFQAPDELYTAPADTASKAKDSVRVEITFNGIERRLLEVPVPPGNYHSLSANDKRLVWIDTETSFERKQTLRALDFEATDNKPITLIEDIAGYEMSADGKKLLLRKGSDLYVIDASTTGSPSLDESNVDLSGWRFSIDPRQEWRQMMVDAWRLHRDYFYDRKMHGLEWPAVLEKYLPLANRVTTRNELNDLQAQMVSELSALHTYVGGGDLRRGAEDITPASLGAVLARDEQAGGYRVEHIYRSDPDIPEELSPLTRYGVGIREGDVIIAINGVPTLDQSPGALLRNQAGKQVRLKVQASRGETRDAIVTPLTPQQASDLRYDEWEYTRRLRVDSMANGSIGYVHLRAMGGGNMAEWQREYYPVYNRQGLIIDARHNRGGNIDSWILGKLLRRAWFYWQGRNGAPFWNMQFAFRGHLVVLVNEWTASDGEAFAEGFRRLGLGPVIGTRTWGGEIWLSGSNVQVDRGVATAAEFGVFGPEQTWLIEGHGVDPDIVVDNLPHATFRGRDAQLEAAVSYLRQRIQEDPRPVPVPPEYPDVSVQQKR